MSCAWTILQATLPPVPWKTYLPWNQSLVPKGLQTAALEDLREGSPSWRYGQGLANQVKGFVFYSKHSRTPTKGFKQGNNVHIVTWEIALAAAQAGSCQGSAWRRDSSAFQDPHLHLLWPYPIQASAQPIGLLPREPDPFSLLYLPDKASPSDLIWGLLISCAYKGTIFWMRCCKDKL